ncbi:MAG: bifunctional folylpolyglutamate synthase/dihydrofolate synthase [Clostridia bacterium]|nr:bifunctional folylpolyglutamate synthase/dihydrofolate synthase [Clostridia bacterium]
MTRDEAVARIHASYRPGKKSGHQRMRRLLELLGDPHRQLKFVHIAGTNGKGSTAAMLDSILRAAGLRTGRFVSPYLERFEERITVDGEQIGEAALVSCLERVLQAGERLVEEGFTPPTEFETVTAIAFLHYLDSRCQLVVLEAGLGGARDITNLIDTPEVAILTSISLDHTAQLGSRLTDIAKDKGGIIKQGGRVVLYPVQKPEVALLLMKRAHEMGAEVVVPETTALEVTYTSLDGNAFTYRGRPYELPLAGMHQALTAVTVLEAVALLRRRGFDLPEEAVVRGLDSVSFPGRMELRGVEPIRVLDGGHNIDGLETLSRAVDQLLRPEIRRLIVVFGIMGDKSWQPCLETAAAMADTLILTTAPDPRTASPAEMAAVSPCADTRVAEEPFAALRLARELAEAEDGILVCGSLYLVGLLRGALGED